MKIYKYVDARTLDLILQTRRIMFTHPADFNDPFDRPRVPRSGYDFEYISLIGDELMTRERQASEADEAWGKCAVSSFTRAHDNALMWAHYADKHRGAVIEIDTEEAGFTSKHFLIPAQFGSVIYMKRPNPEPEPARGLSALRARQITSGEDRFQIDNYAGLQRLFLTKGLPWAYEEEVRVVCGAFHHGWNADNESIDGSWKKIVKVDGSVGYGWRIRSSAITKVFVGMRYSVLDQLHEQATAIGFEIMLPDRSQRHDFEVHFRSDGDAD